MLHVDLSSLRGPELRRLLDATRERGQAQLSYEILQEMAARRERGGKPSPEPRVVEMNLGDPLDHEEEPLDDEPLDEPLSLAARDTSPRGPDDAVPLHMPREAPPPSPSRPVLWPLAAFALGITLGAGLGWWAGGIANQPHGPRMAPDQTPPPAAATVAEATPAIPAEPPPPPVAPIPGQAAPLNAGEPNVAPEALANPPPAAPPPAPAAVADNSAALPGTADAAETAQAAPAPAAPKRPAKPAAPPAPGPEARPAARTEARAEPRDVASEAEPVRIAPAGPGGCAAQPTPADRTICADPHLQRLQRDLRKAYAEALAAHEDRATLRERQMAWKDARDGVGDPAQLARLYEARIRRLEAATADAKARK